MGTDPGHPRVHLCSALVFPAVRSHHSVAPVMVVHAVFPLVHPCLHRHSPLLVFIVHPCLHSFVCTSMLVPLFICLFGCVCACLAFIRTASLCSFMLVLPFICTHSVLVPVTCSFILVRAGSRSF